MRWRETTDVLMVLPLVLAQIFAVGLTWRWDPLLSVNVAMSVLWVVQASWRRSRLFRAHFKAGLPGKDMGRPGSVG